MVCVSIDTIANIIALLMWGGLLGLLVYIIMRALGQSFPGLGWGSVIGGMLVSFLMP